MNGYNSRIFLALVFLFQGPASAQQAPDSLSRQVQLLKTVQVKAYLPGRPLLETPASVGVILKADLGRYSNTSMLPAMNALPGVRMEERSPSSYRLSIRGSSLRSPFGVRNVKIYYNDIPVSDPGGFSYLNQFGFCNMADVLIIKGPGSSLYGAGNGGVVLINSIDRQAVNSVAVGMTGGSFGLKAVTVKLCLADSNGSSEFRYEHVESQGYRRQSGVTRNVLSWDGQMRFGNRKTLTAHFLYNNLFYQTPGGLTLSEFNIDPRAARPDIGTIAGAERSKAAIYQDNVLAGLSYRQQLGQNISNTTSLYAMFSQVNNPNTRNFSRTTDPHFGGRTVFYMEKSYGEPVWKIQAGAELQRALAIVRTYKNNNGQTDTLLSDEEISSSSALGFAQATLQYRKWVFETGVGLSMLSIDYSKRSAFFNTSATFEQVSPRFAVLYKISRQSSAYVNIARGFSPPTTAELAPSGSSANLGLRPEYGWNYEAGVRGSAIAGKFFYDVSVFYFQLANAIVVRRDSAGGDHYTNAGGTKQQGVESRLEYRIIQQGNQLRSWSIWSSLTGYNFRYDNFMQLDADYTDKQLPGVPAYTIACGTDLQIGNLFLLHLNYLYNDRIALNDANTVYAKPFHLLGAKLQYQWQMKQLNAELFAGADNILDERYSLGNDINAAGGRYYNAASARNFYVGMLLHLSKQSGGTTVE